MFRLTYKMGDREGPVSPPAWLRAIPTLVLVDDTLLGEYLDVFRLPIPDADELLAERRFRALLADRGLA